MSETRRRTAISIEQKRALRTHKSLNPTLSHLALKEWFEDTFQRAIALSSISEILSKRYNHVDSFDLPANKKRFRRECWPELERVLSEWIDRAEGSRVITAEVMKEKAEFFWKHLSVYKGEKMPVFSNGWVHNFQRRRPIRPRTQLREAGSSEEAIHNIMTIRQVLSSYNPEDIFSCDETGLSWMLTPDRSLSTRGLPDRPQEKARITGHLCCNLDGTERLPLWVIGQTVSPLAFRAAGINIHNLGVYWRSSKKAWMTPQLMEEWLRWFDARMAGRKTVLLMDNLSAHEVAAERINLSLQPLQNTLIVWLPSNSTGRHQPFDQGIMRAWKSYWRRHWLRYMLEEYEAGRDPLMTTDILKTVRWAVRAWEIDLSQSTIVDCFRSGLGLDYSPSQPSQLPISEITRTLQRLRDISAIHHPMDIQDFLEPADELVVDAPEILDEQVLSQFEPTVTDGQEEENKGVQILPQITIPRALEALRTLRLFQEQQPQGDINLIRHLNHIEATLC